MTLLEKWAKERKYDMAKRKLWQSIREEWRVKVPRDEYGIATQSVFDQLAVCWKVGYDKGFNHDGNL